MKVTAKYDGKEHQFDFTTRKISSQHFQLTKVSSVPSDSWVKLWSRESIHFTNGTLDNDELVDVMQDDSERRIWHRTKVLAPVAMAQCEKQWEREGDALEDVHHGALAVR